MTIVSRIILTTLLCLMVATAEADNFRVDKIYHPYVLPFERDVEWRLMSRKDDQGNTLLQRYSFGHALSETVILEGFIIGNRDLRGDFGLEGYEVELRAMLTEQGQYWADWGALLEIEKLHNTDDWEVKAGVLTEKEFGRFSLTTNLSLVYEWGENVENEFEAEFKAKFRYRWIPEIQPAIEVYVAEDFIGAGPAFMGIKRFDRQKQLKWELGFIAGFNGDSKDHTLRMSLEYEF